MKSSQNAPACGALTVTRLICLPISWSSRTRRRVRELQLIGRQMSRVTVNAPHAGAFWELFNSRVLQYAVSRGDS